MFSEKDLAQIKEKGIDIDTIYRQLENFKKGFPFSDIIKPAITGDGLVRIAESDCDEYIKKYDNCISENRIVKFVPASGAATRMFSDLYGFMELYHGNKEGYADFMRSNSLSVVMNFFNNINKFAFYNDLCSVISGQGKEVIDMVQRMEYVNVMNALLTEEGLNYGNLPKGLIKFHRYDTGSRTAAEEHLAEGAGYARNSDNTVSLHFTVSPEHIEIFSGYIESVKKKYEELYGVKYDISFSIQKSSTDIIAVDPDNNPFRKDDGSLYFRPGGHGALLENLNDIDADIVFIKNIDNVAPDRIKDTTIKYKKILAGIFCSVRERVFNYLNMVINESDKAGEKIIPEVLDYMENELCIIPAKDLNNLSDEEKKDYIISGLNRPLRVCGMVINQGEPGGGPFWTRFPDGSVSLQLVETPQIDTANHEKKDILGRSTHFSPVDFVCGLKDYKGEKFNLTEFRDDQAGFISMKTRDGRQLKAQELPGLWNGGMTDWITVFVEVPVITFNPVKIINDLLREEHL